jgi:Rieske Fe-S protein
VVMGIVAGAAGVVAGRFVMASSDEEACFVDLDNPVEIPLESLRQEWQPVSFLARFAKRGGEPTTAPGIAVRLPGAGIQAFCTYCPHELCVMNLSQKRQLFCGCHLSAFDPLARGAWISGPAPRGTFRLRFSIVSSNLVITAIESELVERLS